VVNRCLQREQKRSKVQRGLSGRNVDSLVDTGPSLNLLVPWFRRAARAVALQALLVFLLSCGQQPDGPIKALLSDPARYDGQMISLSGALTNLDVRVSHRGNSYYTFELDDGSGRVTIFSFGGPPCPAGSLVTVEGQFLRVKYVSGYTFYNQVDAKRVTCG